MIRFYRHERDGPVLSTLLRLDWLLKLTAATSIMHQVPGPDLDYIVPQLRPLAVEVGDLSLDPNNANEHNERSIEAIKSSLREFKQRKPIVVRREPETGVLVAVEAGNGTLTAARALGWSHVAAVIVEESEIRGKAHEAHEVASADGDTTGWRRPGALRGIGHHDRGCARARSPSDRDRARSGVLRHHPCARTRGFKL